MSNRQKPTDSADAFKTAGRLTFDIQTFDF